MNHAPHSTVIPRYAVATADSEVGFSPYRNLTRLALISTYFACGAFGYLRPFVRSRRLASGDSARLDLEVLQGRGLACGAGELRSPRSEMDRRLGSPRSEMDRDRDRRLDSPRTEMDLRGAIVTCTGW